MQYKGCLIESFLEHVKNHEIKILKDEGLYRHIRASSPKTFNQHFELITWPGFLCYTGDMGTYVFKRLEDMFVFFRAKAGEFPRINPGYWGEKLQAIDVHVGYKEFDVETFLTTVLEIYEDCFDGQEVDKKELTNKKQQLCEKILAADIDAGEVEVFSATREWFEEQDLHIDLWEISGLEYTYHFIWCCYAIQWAISKYDDLTNKKE